MTIALTHFASRAGDHNDRAMQASPLLAVALEERLSTSAVAVGEAVPSDPASWDEELAVAMPALREMGTRYGALLGRGEKPVTALSRCAVALATLPVVARYRPDAVVVWFDAHADLNTPATTVSGYLGGLALSGPLGLWESGLGSGLAATNIILVGARDIDEAEQVLLNDGNIDVVAVGAGMVEVLRQVVTGRPVYVHIDCDVLEPGLVPTDYSVPAGMTLTQLTACMQVLADSEVIGVEVGELETDHCQVETVDPREPARVIVRALEPLLRTLVP